MSTVCRYTIEAYSCANITKNENSEEYSQPRLDPLQTHKKDSMGLTNIKYKIGFQMIFSIAYRRFYDIDNNCAVPAVVRRVAQKEALKIDDGCRKNELSHHFGHCLSTIADTLAFAIVSVLLWWLAFAVRLSFLSFPLWLLLSFSVPPFWSLRTFAWLPLHHLLLRIVLPFLCWG